MNINEERGTITAKLINGSRTLDGAVDASLKKYEGKPEPHPDFENCMRMHKGHHKHQGEIQVFDGDKKRDGAGLIALRKGEDVNILFDDENKDPVKTELSYDKFMPHLGTIAAKAGVKRSGKPIPTPNPFVSHTVTINRGVVRVRDVGDWDAASTAIPERYRKQSDRDDVYQPAKVRFLNANFYGYVATECVVDVANSDRVTIEGTQLAGTYTGKATPSLRAAEETVEILITNYAPQQGIALPWTQHYRWMFEAAGFDTPIKFRGPEFTKLVSFGEDYDKESWICEREMFLGEDGKTGYPFPYRFPKMWRVPLGEVTYSEFGTEAGDDFDPVSDRSDVISTRDTPALEPADPWDPVRCPMGDCSDGRC